MQSALKIKNAKLKIEKHSENHANANIKKWAYMPINPSNYKQLISLYPCFSNLFSLSSTLLFY
jgi:hypothetical protein